MHKFAELSQRIVVEKSVIQKYEEEISTQNNTIKSEISVENCSRMVSSSSSSSSTRKIVIRSSTEQINDASVEAAEIACEGDDAAAAAAVSNGNTVRNGDVNESDQQTSVEHHHHTESGEDGEKITIKKTSKMKLSKITTNGSESIKSNANTPDSVRAGDLLSQFQMTPTSKVPPTEVTVQRPLKPQSEMDFAVPYNIINNYFSVGVVSALDKIVPLLTDIADTTEYETTDYSQASAVRRECLRWGRRDATHPSIRRREHSATSAHFAITY